jgi:hypothetical protein
MSENVQLPMPPFDIFQSEGDGSVLWRGTAATMEEAKARIRELAASSPGQYIILSRHTGSKYVVQGGSASL